MKAQTPQLARPLFAILLAGGLAACGTVGPDGDGTDGVSSSIMAGDEEAREGDDAERDVPDDESAERPERPERGEGEGEEGERPECPPPPPIDEECLDDCAELAAAAFDACMAEEDDERACGHAAHREMTGCAAELCGAPVCPEGEDCPPPPPPCPEGEECPPPPCPGAEEGERPPRPDAEEVEDCERPPRPDGEEGEEGERPPRPDGEEGELPPPPPCPEGEECPPPPPRPSDG